MDRGEEEKTMGGTTGAKGGETTGGKGGGEMRGRGREGVRDLFLGRPRQ